MMSNKGLTSYQSIMAYGLHKQSARFFQAIILGSMSLVSVGCQIGDEKNDYDQNFMEEKIIKDQQEQQEQLDNMHARIAASRNDICPKLLTKEVDRHSIVRKQEHLPSGECDYYIYPKVGERIMATTNNNLLELFLISPYYHDFANGSIVVKKPVKYVIRARYNGIQKQPNDVLYDMVVTVE